MALCACWRSAEQGGKEPEESRTWLPPPHPYSSMSWEDYGFCLDYQLTWRCGGCGGQDLKWWSNLVYAHQLSCWPCWSVDGGRPISQKAAITQPSGAAGPFGRVHMPSAGPALGIHSFDPRNWPVIKRCFPQQHDTRASCESELVDVIRSR